MTALHAAAIAIAGTLFIISATITIESLWTNRAAIMRALRLRP
jgi:hypothetical protein